MTWLASHERSIVSNVTQKDGVVTGMTHPEAMAHLDKASTYDKVSYAFYTLGAAAMVTGVVLWLVLPPDREVSGTGAPAAFTLAPVPGGGILGASGRF
jgi:bacteriorhodopsin